MKRKLLCLAVLSLFSANCLSADGTGARSDLRNYSTSGQDTVVKLHDNGDGTFSEVVYDGASSGGDASAANQAIQITAEQATQATLGAKTDAKSTATDATSISIMQALKQISASVQAPPSQAVTNAGTFAVQATLAAETTKVIGTVNLSASENHLGEVGGRTVIVGGSFTRPSDTTTYASGDLVANSTTAGSVVPITVAAGRINDGTGMIRRVRLKKSTTGGVGTTASFRVHFYKDSPTVTNGDNGVWLSTESNYLGAVDVTMDKTFSDAAKGVGSPNTGSEINFSCSSGTQNIFALVESRGAYPPGSAEVFTVVAEVLQN